MSESFKQAALLPSLTLAYIGDTVYETAVRRYLVDGGLRHVDELHRAAVHYVRASFQAAFYHYLLPHLTESEADVLRRGRNAGGSRRPKNGDIQDYRKATAVEALFGAVYLGGEEQRLRELCATLYRFIEENDDE